MFKIVCCKAFNLFSIKEQKLVLQEEDLILLYSFVIRVVEVCV